MGISVLLSVQGSLVTLDEIPTMRSVRQRQWRTTRARDALSRISAVAVGAREGLLLRVYPLVSRAMLTALEDTRAVAARVGSLAYFDHESVSCFCALQPVGALLRGSRWAAEVDYCWHHGRCVPMR